MRPIAALVAWCAAVSAADASERYDLASPHWEGLASLGALASTSGVELVEVAGVDLADRPLSDPIWVMYPTAAFDPEPLLEWVARGGALVFADDFGTGDALLAGIRVRRGVPPPCEACFSEQPFLPELAAWGAHPLAAGVGTLVLNHPSSLAGAGRGVFEFADESAAVLDLNVGRGVVIAVSDPSVFTNLMLPIRGNAAFAAAVLARACRGSAPPCRIALVREGAIAEVSGPSRAAGRWVSIAPSVWWRRVASRDIDPRALRVASLLLAIGAAFVSWSSFPVGRPMWTRVPWRLPESRAMSEVEAQRERYLGQPGVSFAVPASLLADAVVASRASSRAEFARPAGDVESRPEALGRRAPESEGWLLRRRHARALRALARWDAGHEGTPARGWVSRRQMRRFVAATRDLDVSGRGAGRRGRDGG